MVRSGSSRLELERTLNAAYAHGLISEHTFSVRIEQLLGARLIDVRQLVGDLVLRTPRASMRERVGHVVTTMLARLDALAGPPGSHVLLALDWSGDVRELTVGRSPRCDVVLSDLSVLRRHARALFRDGRWFIQDLGSTNGTLLNGRLVGRSELRPGDDVRFGDARLRVD